MSVGKKLAFNTAIQFIGRFLSIFLGVISIGIVTRYLGVSGYGIYTKVVNLFQIIAVILDLGLANVTLKYISNASESETENIVNKIITLRFFLNLIILIAPLLSILLGYEKEATIGIFIFSISNLISNFSQIWSILLQKKINTVSIIYGELLTRVVFLIAVVLIKKLNLGFISVVIASAITNTFTTLTTYFGAKKYIKPKFIIDTKLWKEILKKCIPFAMIVIFNMIYFRSDTFILSLLKDNADVGMYGAAYKVFEIYVGIPSIFTGLILPILDKANKENDQERFNNFTQKAFDFLSMIAVPIAMGGFLLSDEIIKLLAGAEYVEAGSILGILCISMGIVTMGSLFTNTVIAVNNQKKMMIQYGITAFAAIVLYSIFIPIYSYKAIPYIKIFVEGYIALSAFVLTFTKTKKLVSLKNFEKNIIAASIMCIVIFLIQKFVTVDIFITLPSAIIVYFVTLFLVGGVDKQIILSILRR